MDIEWQRVWKEVLLIFWPAADPVRQSQVSNAVSCKFLTKKNLSVTSTPGFHHISTIFPLTKFK